MSPQHREPIARTPGATLGLFVAVIGCCAACQPVEHEGAPGHAISIELSLPAEECSVTSLEATVTATDMAELGPVPLAYDGSVAAGTISGVPAGADRTVTVTALSGDKPVYEGIGVTDVTAENTASVHILLTRLASGCPHPPAPDATPSVSIEATLATVIEEPIEHAALDDTGILALVGLDSMLRYDLDIESMVLELQLPASITAMAMTENGESTYLAYTTGQIDHFDAASEELSLFGSTDTPAKEMMIAGEFLYVESSSRRSLYRRQTRARSDHGGGSSATDHMWLGTRARILSYDRTSSGAAANLEATEIDETAGSLGDATDLTPGSPLRAPLRLVPGGQDLVDGAGALFDLETLSYQGSLGFPFDEIAFEASHTCFAQSLNDNSALTCRNDQSMSTGSAFFRGRVLFLHHRAGELILVTSLEGGETAVYRVPLVELVGG